MKITFLGSSHGVPEPNRRCSSALIEIGNNLYIMDMGTQAIETLINRGISPNSIKCVFITHMHGDHTNGLISFLDLLSWYYKEANPKIFLPSDIEETKNTISSWLKINDVKMRDFDISKVKTGLMYDDGVLKVTAYKTKHTNSSYAYLLEAEGKRVLFSGDLYYNPSEDFPKEVLKSKLNLAICECAHFDAHEYLPILGADPDIEKLCFNHYSERFLSSVLDMQTAFKNTIVVRATDGYEIIV